VGSTPFPQLSSNCLTKMGVLRLQETNPKASSLMFRIEELKHECAPIRLSRHYLKRNYSRLYAAHAATADLPVDARRAGTA
jgi:hypothetical protein